MVQYATLCPAAESTKQIAATKFKWMAQKSYPSTYLFSFEFQVDKIIQ